MRTIKTTLLEKLEVYIRAERERLGRLHPLVSKSELEVILEVMRQGHIEIWRRQGLDPAVACRSATLKAKHLEAHQVLEMAIKGTLMKYEDTRRDPPSI